MRKSMLTKSAAIAFLALTLTACGEKEGRSLPSEEVTEAVETETETETEPEEETLSPEDMDALKAEIPADRLGDPMEAAKLILQISEAPTYMTGQIITIDGGWY